MQEDVGREVFTKRARRALALIGLALVVLAGSGGAYLWRSADHPYSGPPPPSTSRPVLVSMTATSSRQAWLMVHDSGGPESFLFHTDDQGAHWRRQLSINGLGVLRFADARRGVLLNYQLGAHPEADIPRAFSTVDAGAHWRSVTMPRLSLGYNANPFFLDPDHGWVVGNRAAPRGGPVNEEHTLWRTRDGGAHWEQMLNVDALQPLDHGVSGRDLIVGISFLDPDRGWMVTLGAAATAALYVTHDGGHNWTRFAIAAVLPALAGEVYVGLPSVSRDGRGMMSVFDRGGNQFLLLGTSDGGDSWAGPRPVPSAGPLNSAFVNGSVAWVANGAGAWVTADSGRSWLRSAALPGGMALGDVAPVDASVAWVQGLKNGAQSNPVPWALFHTGDGGRHWRSVAAPSLG
jgi:photosystem II stability/assembly factor-like uncharacterized protein